MRKAGRHKHYFSRFKGFRDRTQNTRSTPRNDVRDLKARLGMKAYLFAGRQAHMVKLIIHTTNIVIFYFTIIQLTQ